MPPEIGQDSIRYSTPHRLSSAIGANQAKAAILDDDLTNKNVNGHISREVLIQSNGSAGVKESRVQQNVDEKLITEVRDQSSMVAGTESMNKYYHEILDFFGGKDTQSSFAHIGGKMSTALIALQSNLGHATFTKDALRELVNHAESITQLASKIKSLHKTIGNDIAGSVNTTNDCLKRVAELNKRINLLPEHSSERLTYQNQRRVALHELAAQLGVSAHTFNPNAIYDKSENNILQGDQYSTIHYDDFNGTSRLSIATIDHRTVDISRSILESNQTGRLSGLMKLHDEVLPDLEAQLDEYTKALRDKFNSIHNLGVSLDPPSTLTSTVSLPGSPIITTDTLISGVGTVRIGAADPKTGELAIHKNIILRENMTIQDLINSINYVGPSSGVTASITSDGRFQLQSDNPEHGVVIGSVGTQIASLSTSSTYNANNSTNLSHFFGLNNLFETGTQSFGQSISGISSSLSVRKGIVESNGKRISLGSLSNSESPVVKAINTGDSSTISLLANAYNESSTSFNRTPLSSPTKTSLKAYAIDIVNIQKIDIERTEGKLKNEKFVYIGLSKRAAEKSKVNEKKVLLNLLETNKSIDILSKAMSISYRMSDSIFKIT